MVTASIVLHRTSPEMVESVLSSLEGEPVDHVYLVDNSPSFSAQDYKSHIPISVFHIPNKGYGNAHNYAIRLAAEAGSEFHLVINPDVRWNSPVIGPLLELMRGRPRCALAHPRIVYPDGRLQHTCRLLPTPFDVFAKRFLPSAWIRRSMKRYLLPDSAYTREFNPVYVQGSFMLFRTSALTEIGMFDERFFMYPEDIDISRRIRNKYDALYSPSVTIVHDHAASSSRFGRMLWIHIVNMMRYFNKWGWFFDPQRRILNRRLLDSLK